MLFNWKPIIGKYLRENEKIRDFVAKDEQGNPVIATMKLPAGRFPAIEYHQIGGLDQTFSNDKVATRTYNFQVSIHTDDASHTLIDGEVDKVMRELGFICYFDYENYEQEVKVYNRYLLYRQTITVERIAYLNSLI